MVISRLTKIIIRRGRRWRYVGARHTKFLGTVDPISLRAPAEPPGRSVKERIARCSAWMLCSRSTRDLRAIPEPFAADDAHFHKSRYLRARDTDIFVRTRLIYLRCRKRIFPRFVEDGTNAKVSRGSRAAKLYLKSACSPRSSNRQNGAQPILQLESLKLRLRHCANPRVRGSLSWPFDPRSRTVSSEMQNSTIAGSLLVAHVKERGKGERERETTQWRPFLLFFRNSGRALYTCTLPPTHAVRLDNTWRENVFGAVAVDVVEASRFDRIDRR